MAKLPGLGDLIRLADAAGDHADRVLKGDVRDWSVQERPNELQSLSLFTGLVLEPARPTDRQVRAGWVGDHHAPVPAQHLAHIALDVLTADLARQQIAAPRVVAAAPERLTHHAREFAG